MTILRLVIIQSGYSKLTCLGILQILVHPPNGLKIHKIILITLIRCTSHKAGNLGAVIERYKMFIEKIMNRFEDKFIKRANGCWLWISSHNKSGYGLLWINRKGIKAHRIAYTLYKGIIPFGMHVLHRCDNPPCVNPDHLFLGTQTDNNLDRDKKGRNNVARGEDTALAKLTTKDVLAIRKSYIPYKNSSVKLAKKYGVKHSTILNIISNKTWKHL